MSYMTRDEHAVLVQTETIEETRSVPRQRVSVAAGALGLLLGGVGPWATALGAISIGPTASAEYSIVVFGGAVLVILAALLARSMRAVSIVVGVAALIEAGYAMHTISDAKTQAGEFGALIQPGWGLYLTAVAGLFLVASTWVAKFGQTS